MKAEEGPGASVPIRDSGEALAVLGVGDEHARAVRQALGVTMRVASEAIEIGGPALAAHSLADRLEGLLAALRGPTPPGARAVRRVLLGDTAPGAGLSVYGRQIATQGPGQVAYLEALHSAALTIVTGTAGSGKTFLAVAKGAQALQDEEVERLVFCRPVVETGEHLGFLPGDVEEKMAPYFRPIQDALYRVLGLQRTRRLTASGRIEIAPLAYMRGRTLDDAFILLDEAQNTSVGQMRMFLTRLGSGSRAVVTGDPTQSDLPAGIQSGLRLARERLDGLEGVALVALGREDVVRHPLVAQIDRALGAG